MNGLLLLGVLHVAELVIVGLPLKEKVADLFEAIVSTVVEGRPLTHIQGIDVSATR